MSEEDIKILKEKIEFWKNDPRIMIKEENYRILRVLENILKERLADEERIKELKEQVEMLDKAYSGAIKESKKYFEIVKDSIPKAKIKEIVDECIPVGKNITTGKEEYQPNANANSYLTQMILELLKDGGE